jgi:Bacteriophage probable baseplate hub protein
MSAHARYVPGYEVRINGQELPAAVRSTVSSVRYEDGRNAADRVEIELGNPDLRWLQNHIRGLGFRPPTGLDIGPVRAFQAAPAGTFDLDNSLTLSLGYLPGPLELMFQGEVTGIEASFPGGGMPTLRLVAHDKLNRLSRGSGAQAFGFLPDFLVASITAAKNLLIPVIDPAVTVASTALAVINFIFSGSGLAQAGQSEGMSDLDLLTLIATKYGADFWVEGDVLYLSRFIKEYEPSVSLKWGESLIDFSPRISNVGQVAGVGYRFTLREIPLSFLVTVYWDFDRETLGLSVIPGAAAKAGIEGVIGGKSLTRVDRPITSPADVVSSALEIEHELRTKLNGRLTGSLTAIGNPAIRAGAVIRLEGLGPDFSMDYRVSSATQSFDGSGWVTKANVYKEIIP